MPIPPVNHCMILTSLTWVFYDYFLTLEDEVEFIWLRRPWNFAKIMYLWMRYYTIVLMAATTLGRYLSKSGIGPSICLGFHSARRIAGAISLWSVEIIIQVRIYALYGRSRKIAIFNAALFILSVLAFASVLTSSAVEKKRYTSTAIRSDTLANKSVQWIEWMPAIIFEFNLFGFAAYKFLTALDVSNLLTQRRLSKILINDNILYFMGITAALMFNNLEVMKKNWFSFGPFYALVGIMTCRMLLRPFKEDELNRNPEQVVEDFSWTVDQNDNA